jgi:prolyl-tRNA editing enzyme YbaK/EbsC (Cys-tRNA(Pro) deacylase)
VVALHLKDPRVPSKLPQFELGAIPPLPGLLGLKAYVDPSVLEHDDAAFADGRRTESMIASPREMLWGEDVNVTPIAHELRAGSIWAID